MGCPQLFHPAEQVYLLYGMAVALGLLLSSNSPTLLSMASRVIPERGSYYYLAWFLASVSGFWGIVGLALLLSFWHFPFFESEVFLRGGSFLLFSTLFPILLGFLFHFLTKKKTSEEQMLVYLLGLVFFVSGAAFYFNLPPLYLSMVLGITFSNLTKIHEKLYPLLLSTEKPLYIIFLILIGALWDVNLDQTVVILVVLMVVLRVLTYISPLSLFKVALDFPLHLPARFGLCFLFSGGIGVALTVSIKLAYPLPLTDIFLTIALFGILFTEFISPWGLKFSVFQLDQRRKNDSAWYRFFPDAYGSCRIPISRADSTILYLIFWRNEPSPALCLFSSSWHSDDSDFSGNDHCGYDGNQIRRKIHRLDIRISSS